MKYVLARRSSSGWLESAWPIETPDIITLNGTEFVRSHTYTHGDITMPKENTFSNFSMTNLETAHGDLIALFRRVITVIDCRVLEGHRSPKRQHELFLAGMSKIDWKTAPGKEPWNPGRHGSTPSSAVDVAPYPINWSNTKRFYHFAGIVRGIASKMDIPLRWGGDMDLDDQNFMDLVHFEREDR